MGESLAQESHNDFNPVGQAPAKSYRLERLFKRLLKCAMIILMFSYIDTGLTSSPTLLLAHLFIILLLPVLLWKHRVVPKPILLLTILFFSIGLVEIFLGNNTFSLLVKTLSGIFFLALFSFYVIREFDYDIRELFRIYVTGALITCYIFLFQYLSVQIGFTYGYKMSYLGVHYNLSKDGSIDPAALLPEPSALAVLLPALFISLYNLLRKERHFLNVLNSIIVIVVILISSSSTVYMGLIVCLIMLMISMRAFTIFVTSLVLGVAAFLILYSTSEKFKLRLDDSIEVFINKNVTEESLKEYNGSTLALYNHMLITTDNFMHNPVFGGGIGSHEIAFRKYSQFDERMWWYDLNHNDANSMFLRLVSETGLFGICLLLFFMLRFNLKKARVENLEYWLINKGIIAFLIIALLRTGNYMSWGFPFFLILYYYNGKMNKIRPKKVAS